MKFTMLTSLVLFATNAMAANPAHYLLTVTNGGNMPISPAVIYTKTGATPETRVGQMPSQGFVQLCQTGNGATRVMELNGNMSTTAISQTMGLLQPGESTTVEVAVLNPTTQSIHFEAMYGKTKDTCSLVSFSTSDLVSLQNHMSSEILAKDQVISTGAFSSPVLPMMGNPCASADNAIACVRTLSQPINGKTHYFAGYLPSLVNFLESKYGAMDTESLLIPSSGAIEFQLKLKH